MKAAFSEVAAEVGVVTVRVDVRTIDPSPPAFLAALTAELGSVQGTAPLDALAAGQDRFLLLVDTYEVAGPLDEWLREWFLPRLPVEVPVVIAGRIPPGPAWLCDPGWREPLQVVGLRNLEPDEARKYLRGEGLTDAVQERVVEISHGHPLALSLFVDVLAQGGEPTGGVVDLAEAPDVVRMLLHRFVEEVPSARHRQALQVCAHTRTLA